MSMKFTDLMLDKATGDASGYDVIIEYDKGRVDVSNVVFEACCKVEALVDAGAFDNDFIQEAADAGLPSEKADAVAQASAAASTGVEAFYDLVVDTAKKIKESVGDDWKAIAALAKKNGMPVSEVSNEGFFEKFATPLAAKLAGGKSLKLSGKAMPTANFSRTFTSNYCNGIAKILSAYGISMECDCPVTKNFVGDLSKNVPCADTSDSCAQQCAQAITHGAKIIKGEGAFSKTANATVKDIANYITAVYVLKGFSEMVVKRAGSASARKTAIAKMTAMMNDTNKKGVSHASKNIMKTTSSKAATIKTASEETVKTFSDALYALTEAINGGEAPLPAAK